jgi:hypothetical protein
MGRFIYYTKCSAVKEGILPFLTLAADVLIAYLRARHKQTFINGVPEFFRTMEIAVYVDTSESFSRHLLNYVYTAKHNGNQAYKMSIQIVY